MDWQQTRRRWARTAVMLVGALALVIPLADTRSASAERGAAPAASRFSDPHGVTVDAAGNVYVIDRGKYKVIELSPTGKALARWGKKGKGPGMFSDPQHIAVDAHRNVYVTDWDQDRVQTFSATGRLLSVWGHSGGGAFFAAHGVTVDAAGNVYVGGANGVVKVTPTGKQLATWSVRNVSFVHGVAVDRQGNIYATDAGNLVSKLSPTGKLLAQWGKKGTGFGQLEWGEDVALDRAGDIFVADSNNNRITEFSPAGRALREIGRTDGGEAPGQFSDPNGVAIGPDGDLYVADSGNSRVQKLTPAGKPLAAWG